MRCSGVNKKGTRCGITTKNVYCRFHDKQFPVIPVEMIWHIIMMSDSRTVLSLLLLGKFVYNYKTLSAIEILKKKFSRLVKQEKIIDASNIENKEYYVLPNNVKHGVSITKKNNIIRKRCEYNNGLKHGEYFRLSDDNPNSYFSGVYCHGILTKVDIINEVLFHSKIKFFRSDGLFVYPCNSGLLMKWSWNYIFSTKKAVYMKYKNGLPMIIAGISNDVLDEVKFIHENGFVNRFQKYSNGVLISDFRY